MADLSGFDATKVDPNVGFEPVPAGDYMVIATESEMKQVKDNPDAEYLQFTLEIIEGDHKKRLLFDRLNLKNPSDTAVKIAQGTLSAICHAVGVMKPKDSSELHNKPMIAKVALEPYKDGFSNDVKGYSAVSGSGAKIETANTTADSTVPPWKR
jgi:hypothetical protein